MRTVIKVENISKQYRLGTVGTGSLAHDLNRTWHRVRGKEDPYLMIGEENDRTQKGSSDYVWALKDINFEVQQGEVLGIIGRNGAGKSTLLKILSRTTTPTTGSIKIKGRVASLLEVGTGFHPELSGRENIFLNGAILGMSRQEIKSKFDEIVDFAGVERYIDTPVKRYSSGMYVRLAFGVAAHLEPEILIVDEVLAVGDAEFQKKALGKMKDVSNREGRTVIFVSHNITAIKNLCSRGLYLKNGAIHEDGDVENICRNYLKQETKVNLEYHWTNPEPIHGIKINKAVATGKDGNTLDHLTTDDEIKITLHYEVIDKNCRVGFTIGLWNELDELIFLSLSNQDPQFYLSYTVGVYTSSCLIPKSFLNDMSYFVSVNIFDSNYENGVTFKNVLHLDVNDGSILRRDYSKSFQGLIRPELKWETVTTNH